jgi:selenium metabolism protein YedF
MTIKIDARGLACPEPVIKTKEALAAPGRDTIEILVDNEGAVGNLERLAKSKSLACSVTKQDKGCWRVSIIKENQADQPAAVSPVAGEGTFLIVGTDALGRDEALGKILMIRFFETMAAGPDVPHTIFFLNAGVRLTTTEDSVVPEIQKLADKGANVFSCGTCLKFYELESSLKVGKTGSIDQVVDAVAGPRRVVWV